MKAVNDALIEETEQRLLLEGILNCYGFDFRDYAPEPLKRRIWDRAHMQGVQTLSGYQEKILHDPSAMDDFLLALRDDETRLFQDPEFWRAFRAAVVPVLRTYPSVQIWVPECGRGEDAFALAILLLEEGVLQRTRIYATDFSETILRSPRQGVLPTSRICADAEQYLLAGGKTSLSDYYRLEGDRAVVRALVREPIVFAEHNLATDAPFNEFQAIIYRRSLGYFNEWLQERVHNLFVESLGRFGVLALGRQDPSQLRTIETYEALSGVPNLYRKVKACH
jgi:chemotaxis protein methyltransferase CheR